MKKLLWILPVALFALSCEDKPTKMPWEDDLGSGTEQTPDNTTPDDTTPGEIKVGDTLTPWSAGELDIHAISTGRGECLFYILPDGTTMVVDAGEFSRETAEYKNVIQRPNSSIRPTKVYANYIRHFLPKGKSTIDYFHLSHFHMDHMGNLEKEYVKDDTGTYTLAGVTALYHHVPFLEVIDRAYGNYDGLKMNSMSDAALANYREFLDYQVARKAIRASQFKIGAVNQFALKYNAAAYPDFKIENVCSNGFVWENGTAVDAYNGKSKAENAASCGFVIRYGKFDFHSAGDIGNGSNLELRVAQAVGQVEATKAHHHLSPASNNENMMKVLKPQVLVATSFYVREIQPDKSKFDYITEKNCDIFCTSVGESLLEQYPTDYAKCNATSGHIVIRVAPKGDSYMVYTLDDMTDGYVVKYIDGPYNCR